MKPTKFSKTKVLTGVIGILLCITLAILAIVNQDEIAKAITPAQVKEQHLKEPVTEIPDGYIGIYNATDLNNVRNDLTANYILMADVDLSSIENFVPIGDESNPFTGIFDGNTYKINNLKIESSNKHVGLFGYISGGTVKRLGLRNINITIPDNTNVINVGGIVGEAQNGSLLEEVYATGNTQIGELGETTSNIGGLIGKHGKYNDSGTNICKLVNAYSTVEIDGVGGNKTNVGGLIGYAEYSSVENSYSIGKIDVINANKKDGLIGRAEPTKSHICKSSYYAPEMANIVSTIYFDGMTNASYDPNKRTVQQMFNDNNYLNWDFDDIWTMGSGVEKTFPYLFDYREAELMESNYEYIKMEGEGTSQSPYLIRTKEQFLDLKNTSLEAEYSLESDLDFTNYENYENSIVGNLNGNNHIISNISIESNKQCLGLFSIQSGGIKDLNLKNINVKCTSNPVQDQYAHYNTKAICLGLLAGKSNYNKRLTNIKILGDNKIEYVGESDDYLYIGGLNRI